MLDPLIGLIVDLMESNYYFVKNDLFVVKND